MDRQWPITNLNGNTLPLKLSSGVFVGLLNIPHHYAKNHLTINSLIRTLHGSLMRRMSESDVTFNPIKPAHCPFTSCRCSFENLMPRNA